MPDRAMLESSMLIHRDSANYLLALARTGALDVAVSARLLEIASSEPETLVRRLAPHLDIPPTALDVVVIEQLAQELPEVVETYRRPELPEDTWYDGGGRLFIDALMDFTHDELVAEILFEEYVFLNSESWLYSKTRRAFDAMVEAGGTALHMSQRLFDRVVRKSLKKEPDEPLTPGNRVKAAAKWIAIGGPAIFSVVEPLTGTIASAASGYFLLVDP